MWMNNKDVAFELGQLRDKLRETIRYVERLGEKIDELKPKEAPKPIDRVCHNCGNNPDHPLMCDRCKEFDKWRLNIPRAITQTFSNNAMMAQQSNNYARPVLGL